MLAKSFVVFCVLAASQINQAVAQAPPASTPVPAPGASSLPATGVSPPSSSSTPAPGSSSTGSSSSSSSSAGSSSSVPASSTGTSNAAATPMAKNSIFSFPELKKDGEQCKQAGNLLRDLFPSFNGKDCVLNFTIKGGYLFSDWGQSTKFTYNFTGNATAPGAVLEESMQGIEHVGLGGVKREKIDVKTVKETAKALSSSGLIAEDNSGSLMLSWGADSVKLNCTDSSTKQPGFFGCIADTMETKVFDSFVVFSANGNSALVKKYADSNNITMLFTKTSSVTGKTFEQVKTGLESGADTGVTKPSGSSGSQNQDNSGAFQVASVGALALAVGAALFNLV